MATTLSLLRCAPLPPRLTRSSFTINLTPSPNRLVRIRPRVPPISASYTVPAIDRAVSMLTYIIPFLNTLPYGILLYFQHPLIISLSSPFLPMFFAYQHLAHRLTGLDFLAFIILYVYLAVNPHMRQYVHFSAMQALMLDVMLFLPTLARRIFGIPKSLIGLKFQKFCYGAIFVLGYVTFFYIMLCCLVGYTPYLPFVSSVVDELL